ATASSRVAYERPLSQLSPVDPNTFGSRIRTMWPFFPAPKSRARRRGVTVTACFLAVSLTVAAVAFLAAVAVVTGWLLAWRRRSGPDRGPRSRSTFLVSDLGLPGPSAGQP